MSKANHAFTPDSARAATPADASYAAYLAEFRRRQDEADRRDFERRRAQANRPILERAIEDEALLFIDLDIPDADYRGADPLAVFAANHERKVGADFAFDNRPDRLRMAMGGD